MKNLLVWLLLSTRGGPTRARLLKALREKPMNAHRLAGALRLSYRAVRRHLQVLKANNLLVTPGEGYGEVYFLSPSLEECLPLLDEVLKEIRDDH